MDKNMLYYHLKESMTDGLCPICTLVEKDTRQFMSSLLYENVNDPGLREKIRKARGFCCFHSRMLQQMGDPLAHALIYRDLIRTAIEDAEKGRFSPYADHSGCIFCAHAGKAEADYLSEFVSAFREEDFREAYRQGGMLCMTHLQALSGAKAAVYPQILEMTLEKYRALLPQLEEIRRKNDYRFTSEPWSPGAKDSWKRAVGVVDDRAGLRK